MDPSPQRSEKNAAHGQRRSSARRIQPRCSRSCLGRSGQTVGRSHAMNLAPLARVVLSPLSVWYDGIVKLRAWLYERRILRSKRLQTPVISVGNLTLGGTGKTPMVIWLAERFLAQRKRVAILTRRYQASEGSSDEIQLMKSPPAKPVQFRVHPE